MSIGMDGSICMSSMTGRIGPTRCTAIMGDGTFMDMAASWGIDIGIYSMSSSFGDFDKDGDWDIMVSNGASDGNHFHAVSRRNHFPGNRRQSV